MNFLITGANSGIGLEILKILFKNKKNNFFIISKKKTAIKINKRIKFYKLNLNNEKNTKNTIKKIINDSSNKIDVIICNAAEGTFGSVDKIKLYDFKRNYNTNFFSHLIIIKRLLPIMIRRGTGHIINIASGSGIYGFKDSLSYSLGKSSMQLLIETLYEENKNNNIYAKNIFPGLTKTNFVKKNKYIYKTNNLRAKGKDKKFIATIIVKNLFSKRLNIFCQSRTRASFLIKAFPILNLLKKIID